MRADRHAHLCQAGDRLRQPGPTLQLDHVCAGLHQADRVGKGLGHGMADSKARSVTIREPLLPRFTQAVR